VFQGALLISFYVLSFVSAMPLVSLSRCKMIARDCSRSYDSSNRLRFFTLPRASQQFHSKHFTLEIPFLFVC
jgi:hypothetical protein